MVVKSSLEQQFEANEILIAANTIFLKKVPTKIFFYIATGVIRQISC